MVLSSEPGRSDRTSPRSRTFRFLGARRASSARILLERLLCRDGAKARRRVGGGKSSLGLCKSLGGGERKMQARVAMVYWERIYARPTGPVCAGPLPL